MQVIVTPEMINTRYAMNAGVGEEAAIHFVSPEPIALDDYIVAEGNTDTFAGEEVLIFHGAQQFGTIAQAGNFSADKEAASTSRDFVLLASGPSSHILSDVRIVVTKP